MNGPHLAWQEVHGGLFLLTRTLAGVSNCNGGGTGQLNSCAFEKVGYHWRVIARVAFRLAGKTVCSLMDGDSFANEDELKSETVRGFRLFRVAHQAS